MQVSAFQSVSRTELEELGALLAALPSTAAMNLATLDGFFAALVARPDPVLPSEYLPIVCGVTDEAGLQQLEQFEGVEALVGLLARQMEAIRTALAAGLEENNVYLPNFDTDTQGRALGNEWANGFLRGLRLRSESWAALLNDPREVHLMVPIFTLAHEHSSDERLRPAPISEAERTDLIRRVTAYLTLINRYFEPLRSGGVRAPVERAADKVGRNDPCPCGSGKKYKQCCGDPQRLH